MFGLKKFYVSYLQDAGMPMLCHGVIEAPDLKYAEHNWERLWRAAHLGYAFSPIGDGSPFQYEQLLEVPPHLTEEQILAIYGDTDD